MNHQQLLNQWSEAAEVYELGRLGSAPQNQESKQKHLTENIHFAQNKGKVSPGEDDGSS